ncbi:GIY-YIG nuclease family protein [Confluentibacter citreus]|uniref:GIY-YIG nuclease family protein n=1 Tax=Confluentibacter citreus TaxID=2007307 RepID=UPI000C28667A|nr:GIY-YIG nuclease family protein [Confluentibacter citreus]
MKEIIKFTKDFESKWRTTIESINTNNGLKSIIDSFDDNRKSINSENYNKVLKKFGIYIFYIKPIKPYDLEILKNDWKQFGYDKYPKISEKRFKSIMPIDVDKWYPFYIGKAENLGDRLKQHITHKENTPTYGLKLNGRDYFNAHNIEYSFWELPDELVNTKKEIKQFLMTQLETKLRNQLKPWIGKQ